MAISGHIQNRTLSGFGADFLRPLDGTRWLSGDFVASC